MTFPAGLFRRLSEASDKSELSWFLDLCSFRWFAVMVTDPITADYENSDAADDGLRGIGSMRARLEARSAPAT